MDLTIDELRKSALEWDQNISRLKIIIDGVNKAIKNLYHNELSTDWWETLDEKQECESIFRLGILAFENYIHSAIRIYFEEEKEDYSKFYELEKDIDLIITLAKHITSSEDRDSDALIKFNLNANDFPIYHGILLLNENKNFDAIIEILKSWRIKLVLMKYPISQ